MDGEYPGDKIQIDIKYVPRECIRFPCYGQQCYQITGIGGYSRKRMLKIVTDKSTYETAKYLKELRRQVAKHEKRYNKTAKTCLDFKTPDRAVSEYSSKCNICVDTKKKDYNCNKKVLALCKGFM